MERESKPVAESAPMPEIAALESTNLHEPPADVVVQPSPRKPIPWATAGILAVLVAVFIAEQILIVGKSEGLLGLDTTTLVGMGGLLRPLVAKGEWYRLLTAAFLHLNLEHILFNGIALVWAGAVLEATCGAGWLLGTFVLGAIGGSLVSLALNPANMVSVGASGAIMALLAAALVSTFHEPASPARKKTQMRMLRILVPSLLPIATVHAGEHVDYADHLGGTIVGVTLGFVLWKTWPANAARPRLRRFAWGVTAAAAAVLVVGTFQLHRAFAEVAVIADMIPDGQVPDKASVPEAQQLVARYPKDPRSHFALAQAYVAEKNLPGAESALRDALAQRDAMQGLNNPELFQEAVATTLAGALIEDAKTTEARQVAAPICQRTGVPDEWRPEHERLVRALHDGRLCPDQAMLRLIPDGTIPDKPSRKEREQLAADYPQDPRAYLLLADQELEDGNPPQEREATVRRGLAQKEAFDALVNGSSLQEGLNKQLAFALLDEGKAADARRIATSICDRGAVPQEWSQDHERRLKELRGAMLCPEPSTGQ